MRTDECESLLARARGGDAEALTLLIAGTRGDLRLLIAAHAASAAMIDELVAATWEEAHPRLANAPAENFAVWLWDVARELVVRALHERERAAGERKDPIAHAIARQALEGVGESCAEQLAALAALRAAVEAIEPALQLLLRKRYGDGQRVDALGGALGQAPSTVAATLFRARAAVRGRASEGEALLASDPLFAGLVEDYLAETQIPEARELLAGSVTKDLQYCAAFETQVRADLLLGALFAPAALDGARELAQALSPAPRASQRLRTTRASERTSRISDGRRRVASGPHAGASNAPRATSAAQRAASGPLRIGSGPQRAASGPQDTAVAPHRSASSQQRSASGARADTASSASHRRAALDPSAVAPAGRSGGPWTLVGIAVVALAVLGGVIALSGGTPSVPATAGRTTAPAVAAASARSPDAPARAAATSAAGRGPTAPDASSPGSPASPAGARAPLVAGGAALASAAPAAAPSASSPLGAGAVPLALRLAPPAGLRVGVPVQLPIEVVGACAAVELLVDSASVGTATAAPYAIAWTPAHAGTVRLQPRATDVGGRVVLGDLVLSSVAAPAPAALAVVLLEPGPAEAFTAPAAIALSARTEGPLPERVEYWQGSAKIAESERPPYAATWSRVPAGSYRLSARAVLRDQVAVSAERALTVAAPAAGAPSARLESPADLESIADGAKPVLRARASARDGAVAKVEFLVDGIKVGEKSAAPYTCPWPKPAYGEHLLQAVAIDQRGARGLSEGVLALVGQKTLARFVRGVVFGADALEVERWRMLPLSAAQADGFNPGNGRTMDAVHPPAGELDAPTRALFAHGLTCDDDTLRCSQALPDGPYQVWLWTADIGESTSACDVELEGVRAGAIARPAKGGWSRQGPFATRVADGVLNIALHAHGGRPLIAGLAIYGAAREGDERGFSWEVWRDVPGMDLQQLYTAPHFPNAPDEQRLAGTDLRGLPVASGARGQAWLLPPRTGVYQLMVKADDAAQLLLSSDETTQHLTAAGRCPGATDEWNRFPEQLGPPVALVAGHRYLLRALYKGGPGNNWFAVGWRQPDGSQQAPLDAAVLIPAPAAGWSGLATTPAHAPAAAPSAEPPAPAASIASANPPPASVEPTPAPAAAPREPPALPGAVAPAASGPAIAIEYWDHHDVPDLAEAARSVFTRAPDQQRFLGAFASPPNRADQYAARVHGEFSPPQSGDYRFVLHGDDYCDLWLSEGAGAPRMLASYRYDGPDGRARSAPVRLEQGKRYRLEARMIELAGEDVVVVGWELPDGTSEYPIPAARFGAAAPPHGFKREVWRPLAGNIADDLADDPRFGQPAPQIEWLPGLACGEDGVDYGARLSGWIQVPSDGLYVLRLFSDGDVRVTVGLEDRRPEPGIIMPHTLGKATRTTPLEMPIRLRPGRVWLELLQKRDRGQDGIVVGWTMPDGRTEIPIDAQRLIPAP